MTVGTCALCQKQGELQKSHFLPKFASRVSRKWSSSAQKRFFNEKGQLRQDSPQKPLMCLACEHIIGRSEDKFRRYMYDSDAFPQYPESYGPWLSLFAAGLLFRTTLYTSFQNPALERAKFTLRDYILEEGTLGQFSLLHLRMSDFSVAHLRNMKALIDEGGEVRREPYEMYMTASLDWRVVHRPEDNSFLALYVHIPFHSFWMPIAPSRVRGAEWRNVKIKGKGKFVLDEPQAFPAYYHDFIQRRVLEISASLVESAFKSGGHS